MIEDLPVKQIVWALLAACVLLSVLIGLATTAAIETLRDKLQDWRGRR